MMLSRSNLRLLAIGGICLLGLLLVIGSNWSESQSRVHSSVHHTHVIMTGNQEAVPQSDTQQVIRTGKKQLTPVHTPHAVNVIHDNVAPFHREDIVLLHDSLRDVNSANASTLQLDPRKELSPDVWGAQLRLDTRAVAPNVHYFWCTGSAQERWFEFKHYISVLSVIRALNPHKIVFHYDKEPTVDKNQYNLWLRDLKNDYQFLIMQQMTNELTPFCAGDRDTKLKLILQVMNAEGGFYVSENTWLLQVPVMRMREDFESALDIDSLDGYVMLRKNTYRANYTVADYVKDASIRAVKSTCSPVHQIYSTDVKTLCMNVKGDRFNRFYPMDIWDLDDPFGRLVRSIFYGTEKILKPKPSYDTLVPNIGHMIWIGGGAMDFVFYLSLLSMLFVARVDVVFIHGDQPPHGVYWDKLQSVDRIRSRIKCIQTTPPLMVYQGYIEPYYRALMSDIIRVDLMIKYGGVYMDTDAIWTKPLSLEDRGYDAVACYDWVDWSYPYPDSVNFGISYGKRNAPFWRLFRDSMRVLNNDLHGFTGVMYPYKILEKYPQLIRIDKRLSVICYYSKCHPIWVEDYHNMNKDHTTENNIPNWREDVHAFHWTHPNPPEYANETALLSATGIFAEIGQNVLRKAGLIT